LKGTLVLVVAAAAALVALPAGALGSSSRTTTNTQSFVDSTGEDPNAPDITGINVSNTDGGLITFHVAISNRPTLTSDMTVLLWLDTDANPRQIYVMRGMKDKPTTPDVYRLDMTQPDAIMLSSQFQLQPMDVVYVGTAASTTFNRVLQQVLPTVQTLFYLKQLTR